MEKSIKEDSLVQQIRTAFSLEAADIRTYSALSLAYIGDGIYELIIRTLLMEQGINHVNKLHKKASELVKASAQKEMFFCVEELLTEEEMQVFKRGRNVKSSSVAKNATVADYRIATGFEAMIGYLYLLGQTDRILTLLCSGLEQKEKDKE